MSDLKIVLFWLPFLIAAGFGLYFVSKFSPTLVCSDTLMVERRFGFDYPASEYENAKNLPTYIGRNCEKVYP